LDKELDSPSRSTNQSEVQEGARWAGATLARVDDGEPVQMRSEL